MKLYAPKYYNEFKCIADKCTHSCCIGWEIDVDDDAWEKYSSLLAEYGEEIRKSIDFSETPHFKLGANERCPHLDEAGLCKIIKNLGEGFLCHICREHPRFYNDVPYGKEVGVGMACEEAARIVLTSDSFGEIVEVGEVSYECNPAELDEAVDASGESKPAEFDKAVEDFGKSEPAELDETVGALCESKPAEFDEAVEDFGKSEPVELDETVGALCESKTVEFDEIGSVLDESDLVEFDSISHRQKIFSILSDTSLEYIQKHEKISQEYGVSLSKFSDVEWRKLIDSFEYLDENHKELFWNYSSETENSEKYEKYLLRVLAYFVYRHCSDVYDEADFCSALGFSLFCERLFSSVLSKTQCEDFNEIIKIARIISEELEYSEDNTEAIKMCFWDL